MQFEENFFEKEIRCGFEVPSLMKRAWAAEMEVLAVVVDICNNNGLRYFADSGTLLGAIRHQGFVPWDDDIDITMLRKEYDQLIQILPAQIPKGFVIQGIHSNDSIGRNDEGYSQLIVGADQALWDPGEYMKYFHGYPFPSVGIDIFPLDGIPVDTEEYEIQRSLYDVGFAIVSSWDELKEEGKLEYRIKQFEELSGVSIPGTNTKSHIARITDKIAALYSIDECDELDCFMWHYKNPLKKEWYEQTQTVKFENMTIEVPIGYDDVLKTFYGDYKTIKKFTSKHEYPFYKDMEKDMKKMFLERNYNFSLEEFCNKVMSGEIKVQ